MPWRIAQEDIIVWGRLTAKCPFCGSTEFTVRLMSNDWPLTEGPSVWDKSLILFCAQCKQQAFEVKATMDGQISARGVSVCPKCRREVQRASGLRREEDVRKSTYPPATEYCPRCGSRLDKLWWHGSNYGI